MKFEKWTYNKPLSMTGFGGGAGSLSRAGVSGVSNPFDDMNNFPGAVRVGNTDVIYYNNADGITRSFTDPNGGLSRFRFTAVGGGGATTGDGIGGWYGVTGAGGGGAGRGEIQTSQTLGITVGQGGGSPYAMGHSGSSYGNWLTDSLTSLYNNYNRVSGRGGISYVQAAPNPSGHWLIYGTGGLPGIYGYPSNLNALPSTGYSSAFNGNRTYWPNGGKGSVSSGGGVTVTNQVTEFGGTGGCAAHQDGGTALPYGRHPLDGINSYPSQSQWVATAGENTTYAGPGGGGGSDGNTPYNSIYAAGAAGGTASGLNSLLSGSGISSAGGNGSNYGSQGTSATVGTAGGGMGGFGGDTQDTWDHNNYAGNGIVIVEFLGF